SWLARTSHATPAPSLLLLQSYAARRDLHSFPTRRSSDLPGRLRAAGPLPDAHVGEVAGDRIRVGRPIRQRVDQQLLPAVQVEERSEEHTSELQSRFDLVCRLLLEKKNTTGQRVLGSGRDD